MSFLFYPNLTYSLLKIKNEMPLPFPSATFNMILSLAFHDLDLYYLESIIPPPLMLQYHPRN